MPSVREPASRGPSVRAERADVLRLKNRSDLTPEARKKAIAALAKKYDWGPVQGDHEQHLEAKVRELGGDSFAGSAGKLRSVIEGAAHQDGVDPHQLKRVRGVLDKLRVEEGDLTAKAKLLAAQYDVFPALRAMFDSTPEVRDAAADFIPQVAVPADLRHLARQVTGFEPTVPGSVSREPLGNVTYPTKEASIDARERVRTHGDTEYFEHQSDESLRKTFGEWKKAKRLNEWKDDTGAVLLMFARAKEIGIDVSADVEKVKKLPVFEEQRIWNDNKGAYEYRQVKTGTREERKSEPDVATVLKLAPPGQAGIDALHRFTEAFGWDKTKIKWDGEPLSQLPTSDLLALKPHRILDGELGSEDFDGQARYFRALREGTSRGRINDASVEEVAGDVWSYYNKWSSDLAEWDHENPGHDFGSLLLFIRAKELKPERELTVTPEEAQKRAPVTVEGLVALRRAARAFGWDATKVAFAGRKLSEWPATVFVEDKAEVKPKGFEQPLEPRRRKGNDATTELAQNEIRDHLAVLGDKASTPAQKAAALGGLFHSPHAEPEFWEVLPAVVEARAGRKVLPLAAPLQDAWFTAFGSHSASAVLAGLLVRGTAAQFEAALVKDGAEPAWAKEMGVVAETLRSLTGDALRFTLADVLKDPRERNFYTLAVRRSLVLDAASFLSSLKVQVRKGATIEPASLRVLLEYTRIAPEETRESIFGLVEDYANSGPLERSWVNKAIPQDVAAVMAARSAARVDRALKGYQRADESAKEKAAASLARAIERSTEPGGPQAAVQRTLEQIHTAEKRDALTLLEADDLRRSMALLESVLTDDYKWPKKVEDAVASMAGSQFQAAFRTATPAESGLLSEAWVKAYQRLVTTKQAAEPAELRRMLAVGAEKGLLDKRALVDTAGAWVKEGKNLDEAYAIYEAIGLTKQASALKFMGAIPALGAWKLGDARPQWKDYAPMWVAVNDADRAKLEDAFVAAFVKDARAVIERDLQGAWVQGKTVTLDKELLRRVLEPCLDRAAKEIGEVDNESVREKLRAQLLNQRAWLEHPPKLDLAFGERLIRHTPAALSPIPEDKRQLIDALTARPLVGDERDMTLLRHALAALDIGILQKLVKAGYTVALGRNNVTNADARLQGKRVSPGPAGGMRVDIAEGIHSIGEGGERILAARTTMQDGKVVFDVSTLLHEIGHAIDLVLNAKGKDPMHLGDKLADAFREEHQNYRNAYFHDQKEFMAESVGRYLLNREQFRKEFPLTAKALDAALALDADAVDIRRLVELNRSMLTAAPVTVSKDPAAILEKFQMVNAIRQAQNTGRQPYLVGMDGELPAAEAVAKDMAQQLRYLRDPEKSPGSPNEGFLAINSAVFNDPKELRAQLDEFVTGTGALAFVTELSKIPPTSPGFAVLKEFFHKHGDQVPVALHGRLDERVDFLKQLPMELKDEVSISPLTPSQTAELVRRHVANDGYILTEEALGELSEKAKGGYPEAMEIWGQVKQAQFDRLARLPDGLMNSQPDAVHFVLKRDVEGAKLKPKRSAYAELQATGADDKATKVLLGVIDNLEKAQKGEAVKPKRINLTVEGNPGLGKTTKINLFLEALVEKGVLKRGKTRVLSPLELKNNPGQVLAEAFRDNDVVFLDEFHQLKKEAVEALVPLLTDARYKDVIFVVAGYKDRVLKALQQDEGGESRFLRATMEDYSTEKLRGIAHEMAAERGVTIGESAMRALMGEVDRQRRFQLHFGNARVVEKLLDRAQLAAGNGPLLPEHFQPDNRPRLDEVLAEINAIPGGSDVQLFARQLVNTVKSNRIDIEDGLDVPLWKNVPANIYIEGPAGVGKTWLIGRTLNRLYAALDLIEFRGDNPSKLMLSELQAPYVGQSTDKTNDFFDTSVGATGHVDEAYGNLGFEDVLQVILDRTQENKDFPRGLLAFSGYEAADFFKLNSGLARRFQRVLTLHGLSPVEFEGEVRKLTAKELWQYQLHWPDNASAVLTEIAEQPLFSNRDDVTEFVSELAATAKDYRIEHDTKEIPSDVVGGVLDRVLQKVAKRVPKEARPAVVPKPAFARAALDEAKEVHEQLELTDEEKVTEGTLARVHSWFGARFNDEEELKRQEGDVKSEFYSELAHQLGVTPEEAFARRKTYQVKVKKLVQVQKKELVQKFAYDCPYCKRVNHPDCFYFRQPDRFDLAWQIEHSRRKPWTEELVRTEQVEVEEVQTRDLETGKQVVSPRVKDKEWFEQ